MLCKKRGQLTISCTENRYETQLFLHKFIQALNLHNNYLRFQYNPETIL